MVYQAKNSTIERKTDKKAYIGISSLKRMSWFYNHKQTFNNLLLKNQTAQSKYYWELKNKGLTPMIKFGKNHQQQVAYLIDVIYSQKKKN